MRRHPLSWSKAELGASIAEQPITVMSGATAKRCFTSLSSMSALKRDHRPVSAGRWLISIFFGEYVMVVTLEDGAAQANAEDVANCASTPIAKPNPFDPASLRINHAVAPTAAVKKLLTTIHVRKPNKQVFVRVHPSEDYRITVVVIEIKDDSEIYVVDPKLADALVDETTYMTLFTAIDRQGNLFLWPVKLPKDDGPVNSWNASAMAAAQHAMKGWVRIKANRANQAYDVDNVIANCAEPDWPTLPLGDILKIAFRDRYISDLNHPLILKLQGRE